MAPGSGVDNTVHSSIRERYMGRRPEEGKIQNENTRRAAQGSPEGHVLLLHRV